MSSLRMIEVYWILALLEWRLGRVSSFHFYRFGWAFFFLPFSIQDSTSFGTLNQSRVTLGNPDYFLFVSRTFSSRMFAIFFMFIFGYAKSILCTLLRFPIAPEYHQRLTRFTIKLTFPGTRIFFEEFQIHFLIKNFTSKVIVEKLICFLLPIFLNTEKLDWLKA